MDVIIGPRLLPTVKVGDTFLAVEPTTKSRGGKPCWKWYIDGPDFTAEGDDLAGWGNAGEMLESFLSFVAACGESYPDGENADLFPPAVGEWARSNADDLAVAGLDIPS